MAEKVTLSTKKINDILTNPRVLAAARAKAARILPTARAQAIAAGADAFAAALKITEGTRPGTKSGRGIKRPYARVGATVTTSMVRRDQGAKLTRRKVLRRSANA